MDISGGRIHYEDNCVFSYLTHFKSLQVEIHHLAMVDLVILPSLICIASSILCYLILCLFPVCACLYVQGGWGDIAP